MKKTTQLLIPLLAFLFNARAQYQPVTLTASSYNQDVIAEGTGLPSASTTSGFDATAVASYTFPAQNYKNSAACSALPLGQGLPVNGQLIGQGQFQLASYSGANALQLTNTNPTGTFTLATPIATSNFYLLAATGNGAGTMDMTVTFSDATTEQFTAITIDDWFGGANVVFHGGRIGRNETGCGGINIAASGPNLYEFNFALSPSNHSKSIVSISFTRTNTTASELINIMGMSVAASCTSPVAGTVSSSLGSVCSGQSFSLLSTFYAGNSFQWEETPQGTTNWVAISGATSANFTKTGGQASAMDYRAVITCNTSTVTSNVITVGLNPFYDCYCSPLIGTTLHAAGNDVITNVTITGTTLNSSNGTNVNGDGYTKTSPSVAANTASLMRGAQYTITAATTNTDAVDGWIDYDGNGSFDVSEYISFSASSPSSANVTIPLSAVTGLTGMRVRYQAGTPFGASGACTNSGDETEDYTITIVPAVNCSGAPAAATAAATSTLICPNTSFTLTASNVMIGSGIYYQWEEQPVGSSAWNVIAGATNTSHIVSAGITVATNYRMVTNCSFGSSAPSNIISVAVKPPTQCYCTPVYSNGCSAPSVNANARIESVTLAGAGSTAITNTNSGCSANGYGSYLGQSVNLEQGTSYNVMMSFVANSGVTVTPYVAIWIDLDDDGVFSNTTEQLANMGVTATATVPLSIPATALLGAHRMRIRYTFNGNPSAMDPCANLVLGETEDYMVTIVPFANCSGTPATPVASSTSAIVCGTDSFTLSVTGATNGGGVTYQWEALPQGGSWSPLANATNTSYTITGGLTVPTSYRLVSSCPFGNSSTSNIVSVAPGGPTQCYCTPVYSAGGCTVSGVDARIESVTVTGAGSTAITNTNSGCSANGYGSYLGQSVTMEQGASYNMTISFVNSVFSGTPHVAIWIDLDNDGVLSNTTEQLATVAVAATATVPLTIPATALLGTHRMRIRYTYNGNPSAMDPCADLTLGETEDYMVNVTAPLAIKLTAIHAENEGVVNNVLWSTASEDKGDYFILERSANGTDYTDITVIDANGRASSYVYKDHTAPVGRSYYRLKMSDAGGKYSYSKTASAYKKSRAGLSASLYPNPASAAINLELVASGDQEIQYEVVNIIGKVVKSGTYQVTNGMNKTKLDIASVTSGKYFIKIIGKEDTIILSFIKH